MMGFVEGLALSLAGLILVDILAVLIVPGRIVELAKKMARHENILMAFCLVLGAALMFILLESFSLLEIVACGFVLTIFYGVAIIPFYESIVDQLEEDYEEGKIWTRLGPGLLIWLGLALGVFFEWGIQ